ncbi:MAG: glycoside hydrolase family 95-like protein, partial [Chloroflexota bacterium]
EALYYAIRAAEILDVDHEKRQQWREMAEHLPELQTGRHGQLQEWNEDFEDDETSHRHFSHLIGFYPRDMLVPERTPALWRAAEISLERRLAAGVSVAGWSGAWAACMFARLGRSADAWNHLSYLVSSNTTDSLLNTSFSGIFNIEGNLGGAAAVIEMLLQSYHSELHFLPALPAAWPEGRALGLRARGGFELDIEWEAGKLSKAAIRSEQGNMCRLRPSTPITVMRDSRKIEIEEIEKGLVEFPTEKGQEYLVVPKAQL